MFAGIDVSKDSLDVHLLPGGESFSVARDGDGLALLCERLLEQFWNELTREGFPRSG